MRCRLQFSRIQFTPDLMPSDITGTEVIQEDKATGQREFRFIAGPIFANVILADEINRTPPKTQAALLEAMQEHQVTVGGQRHRLPEPFFVLATQNPIEQEGTYPLPEAQLDRFMFNIYVDYPSEEESSRSSSARRPTSRRKITPTLARRADQRPDADRAQSAGRRSRDPLCPAVRPADARDRSRTCRSSSSDYVLWGAGPRASQYLVLGAKARAVLQGPDLRRRTKTFAPSPLPVLRHRIMTNFNAEAEGDQARRDRPPAASTTFPPIPDEDRCRVANSPTSFRSANAG